MSVMMLQSEGHFSRSWMPWNIAKHTPLVDVILEYCPEGDLFSNIAGRGRYVSDDASIRRAFLQILDAVEYC